MNKSYTTDIIIVGGGIAGLTLACLLEKHTDYRVILVERDDRLRQRVSAVNALSIAMWKELGIWDVEQLAASIYQHLRVWDHCGGRLDFDASYVDDVALGYIVEDQALHMALLARIKNSTRIRLITEQITVNISSDEKRVCLQTQEITIYAHYLVGCDGAHSWVRDNQWFKMTSWHYHQTAITAQIVTEKSHRQTAWQNFTAEGPLAFLPLQDIHHLSFVWSVPLARAETLLQLSDEAFMKELTFFSESMLGNVMQLGERHSFVLEMRHVQAYVKNQIILCADAAHTIHPLAGQGLNLAMQDVLSLVHAFRTIQQGEHPSRSLRRYERERKAENWEMILFLEGIKRAYEMKSPAIQMMLNAGVSTLNRCPPLKAFFQNKACRQAESPFILGTVQK